MATMTRTGLRIGELAALTGTTPRTIRYYEEIGLLPRAPAHVKGKHRLYGDADVERLRELMRLRDLLGLTLDELRALVDAEEARAALRREWERTETDGERRRILAEALVHVEAQLDLVRRRRRALDELEAAMLEKRRLIHARRRELAGAG